MVENVERHVREGSRGWRRRSSARASCVGPIIAMTITLATVYTPIGFQGGLTGSLFLEFAITLAAAVVVSGVVAVTLSPVMSARFVHAHGEEGRLTGSSIAASSRCAAATRGCWMSRCEMRWAIVAGVAADHGRGLAAVLRSRGSELAPVEDQSHISLFFEAVARCVADAVDRESLEVVQAMITRSRRPSTCGR